MIQSNQPITTIKTLSYDIDHVLIQKIDGKWKADVQLGVYDQENKRIDTIVNSYENEEYNIWWSNFNSGTDLLNDIIVKNNIDTTLPENIEEDFINLINIETNE